MASTKRKVVYSVIAAAIGILVILALLPEPVPVETAPVEQGAMEVSIDEQGKTRVIDRFSIAAPVAGRLRRIELREGEVIKAGQVVARLEPAPLDAATRRELEALRSGAEAAAREAAEGARAAQSAWELARTELRRIEGLVAGGVISQSAADAARTRETTARRELDAARERVGSAQANARAASARLLSTAAAGAGPVVEVRSPGDGRVLRIPDRSARVVAPGQPILEVGNANRIELVVEVLSEDAVKIEPGDPVVVREWGGSTPLRGTVRVVEPSAFTKFSALGIEEQRVNVIADLVDAPPSLGDAYRIEAEVVIWSDPAAVKVPVSALGRTGDRWSVFVVENGRARSRAIRIGQRNAEVAQVLEGLRAGDRVIVHPGMDVKDGVKVNAGE